MYLLCKRFLLHYTSRGPPYPTARKSPLERDREPLFHPLAKWEGPQTPIPGVKTRTLLAVVVHLRDRRSRLHPVCR